MRETKGKLNRQAEMNLKGFVALLVVLGVLWLATAFGMMS